MASFNKHVTYNLLLPCLITTHLCIYRDYAAININDVSKLATSEVLRAVSIKEIKPY